MSVIVLARVGCPLRTGVVVPDPGVVHCFVFHFLYICLAVPAREGLLHFICYLFCQNTDCDLMENAYLIDLTFC